MPPVGPSMADRASAREWHGPSVPGITGTPSFKASWRADVLSPNKPRTLEGGPMKAMPESSHAWNPTGNREQGTTIDTLSF